jgi:hypothetical protein
MSKLTVLLLGNVWAQQAQHMAVQSGTLVQLGRSILDNYAIDV